MASEFSRLDDKLQNLLKDVTDRYVICKNRVETVSSDDPVFNNIIQLELEAARNDVNKVFKVCLEELGKIDP